LNHFRKIKVSVLIGPPGCGKTRKVYDNHDITDIYKLNTSTNGTLWFDGYVGQRILLIDDFKGWIKFTELLTILDVYPYRCQIKGGYCYANWDEVYITSNYSIDNWYNDVNLSALMRRIHIINDQWDIVKGNTSNKNCPLTIINENENNINIENKNNVIDIKEIINDNKIEINKFLKKNNELKLFEKNLNNYYSQKNLNIKD